jgi:hypothetical protein
VTGELITITVDTYWGRCVDHEVSGWIVDPATIVPVDGGDWREVTT